MRFIRSLTLVILAASTLLRAQDPVAVDPQHNKVEYEDSKLRVIRFSLSPGEKTVMHDHSEMIVVTLTNARARMTLPNGEVQEVELHAGETLHRVAVRHAVENIGTTVWEAIFTELKSPSAEVATTVSKSQPVQNPSVLPVQAVPPPVTNTVPMTAQTESPVRPEAIAPIQQPKAAPVPEPIPVNANGTKALFINGTELAYIDRGQGQPLVFVHDSLGDYRSWSRQWMALSANYHVISYSRRYHYPNHSTGKEGDYTYEQNAKDLADFIHSLNLGPVRIVGHGYGASIAAMVAAEHPELVKTLTITEPSFEALLDSSRAYSSRFAREEIYGIIRKPLSKGDPEKGVQIYVDWLRAERWAGLPTEEQFRRKQNANALRAQTFFPQPPAFACADAKKISAPTLLVSGQNRSPNSAEISGILSACIPNAERVTVPNAGSAPYLDNPEGYTRVLTDFLTKH